MKTAAWFESLILLSEQCIILGLRYTWSINVDKLLVAVPFEENVSLTGLSFFMCFYHCPKMWSVWI